MAAATAGAWILFSAIHLLRRDSSGPTTEDVENSEGASDRDLAHGRARDAGAESPLQALDDNLDALASEWKEGAFLEDLIPRAVELEGQLQKLSLDEALELLGAVLSSGDPEDPRRPWIILASTIRPEPQIRELLLRSMDSLPGLDMLLAYAVVFKADRKDRDPSERTEFWLASFAEPFTGPPFTNWPTDEDGEPRFVELVLERNPALEDRMDAGLDRFFGWLQEGRNPNLRPSILSYMSSGQSQDGRAILFFLLSSSASGDLQSAALDVLEGGKADALLRIEACKAAGVTAPDQRWWRYASGALRSDADPRVRGSFALNVAHWASRQDRSEVGISLLREAYALEADDGVRYQIVSSANSYLMNGRGGLEFLGEIIFDSQTPAPLMAFTVRKLALPAGAQDWPERMGLIVKTLEEHPSPQVQSAAITSLENLVGWSIDIAGSREIARRTQAALLQFVGRTSSGDDRAAAIRILDLIDRD